MAINRHKHGAPYVPAKLVTYAGNSRDGKRNVADVHDRGVLSHCALFNGRWPPAPFIIRFYAQLNKYRVHGASATTNMWYHPTKGWRVTRKDPAPGILKMLKLCQKAWYQPLVTKV
jgi:hypothetical protein